MTVKDFGARGDGRTDDTLALQAAFDHAMRCGKRLKLGPGRYLTRPLRVVREDGMSSFALVGGGSQVPLQIAGLPGSEFCAITPSADPLLTFVGLNGGELKGFNVRGGALSLEAAVGVDVRSITVTDCPGYGFRLVGKDAGVYRNAFTLLGTARCAGGMILTGSSLDCDVAENSFTRIDLTFEGPLDGLRLESADNNDFYGTSIVGPTDNPKPFLLTFCPPDATKLGAVLNRFHGLDGSAHPIVAEAKDPNYLLGLSHVNGITGIGGSQAAKVLTRW